MLHSFISLASLVVLTTATESFKLQGRNTPGQLEAYKSKFFFFTVFFLRYRFSFILNL